MNGQGATTVFVHACKSAILEDPMNEYEPILDDDFYTWLSNLKSNEQREIYSRLNILKQKGPGLKRPYVGIVKGSSIKNLKELIIQIAGDPWRILFAFDPGRRPVILVGGNKTGDDRWYKTNIPIAEKRYQKHLDSLSDLGSKKPKRKGP
jgi:hypothetical protein